jgi:HAMP domain-containing protein
MTEMEERLARYESELVKLKTENDQLRRSAQAFGELAERLNRALLIATAARVAQAGVGSLSAHFGRMRNAGKD